MYETAEGKFSVASPMASIVGANRPSCGVWNEKVAPVECSGSEPTPCSPDVPMIGTGKAQNNSCVSVDLLNCIHERASFSLLDGLHVPGLVLHSPLVNPPKERGVFHKTIRTTQTKIGGLR